MKIILIALSLLFSFKASAGSDLERCNGKYLVSGKTTQQAALDTFLMETAQAGILRVTNKIVGSASVVYALEGAAHDSYVDAIEALSNLRARSGVIVECNSQLSF